ncbi:hypothetical protein AGMMS50239_33860 [Bacteroidia bacterium]|nr:hypothetical protein AGMMS50239_33860 [Bacteroidia bacterium]
MKKAFTILIILFSATGVFAQNKADYGYLYCHMSGRGEFTAFALSRDGVHFHDLIRGISTFAKLVGRKRKKRKNRVVIST